MWKIWRKTTFELTFSWYVRWEDCNIAIDYQTCNIISNCLQSIRTSLQVSIDFNHDWKVKIYFSEFHQNHLIVCSIVWTSLYVIIEFHHAVIIGDVLWHQNIKKIKDCVKENHWKHSLFQPMFNKVCFICLYPFFMIQRI